MVIFVKYIVFIFPYLSSYTEAILRPMQLRTKDLSRSADQRISVSALSLRLAFLGFHFQIIFLNNQIQRDQIFI